VLSDRPVTTTVDVPGCPIVTTMRMIILWLLVVLLSNFYKIQEYCVPSNTVNIIAKSDITAAL